MYIFLHVLQITLPAWLSDEICSKEAGFQYPFHYCHSHLQHRCSFTCSNLRLPLSETDCTRVPPQTPSEKNYPLFTLKAHPISFLRLTNKISTVSFHIIYKINHQTPIYLPQPSWSVSCMVTLLYIYITSTKSFPNPTPQYIYILF